MRMGPSKLASDLIAAVGNLTNATGGLHAALSGLAAVAREIDGRFQELDARESQIKDVEEKAKEAERRVDEKLREMDRRERLWAEAEKKMRIVRGEWEQKKVEWERLEKIMTENAGKVPNKLVLDVGGTQFTTTKTTLLQHKGSFFESLLSTSHPQSESEYFIDHDPKHFPLLLNYLREGKLRAAELESVNMVELQEEFEFFRIPTPFPAVPRPSMITSPPTTPEERRPIQRERSASLMGGDGLLYHDHKKTLTTWLPNKKFELLYKATRDGFLPSDFHETCDNQGATITLAQTKKGGFVFGGYTSQPWDGTSGSKSDPTAFLFTLTNPNEIPPTRYPIKPEECENAIYCSTGGCAIFGDGRDLYVAPAAHQNTQSYANFPTSYLDTTGRGQETFTGTQKFTIGEVEVYSVS